MYCVWHAIELHFKHYMMEYVVTSVLSIRMQEKTLKQTIKLQKSFSAPSKSDVIRRAIELSDAMASLINEGCRIVVENKDGSRSRLILPGLNK